MKFSHEYSKLKNWEFTTIRKNMDYYKEGWIISIKSPEQEFKAKILDIIPIKKEQITEELAGSDASCTKAELISLLEGWYGSDYNDFILITLRRLTDSPIKNKTLF